MPLSRLVAALLNLCYIYHALHAGQRGDPEADPTDPFGPFVSVAVVDVRGNMPRANVEREAAAGRYESQVGMGRIMTRRGRGPNAGRVLSGSNEVITIFLVYGHLHYTTNTISSTTFVQLQGLSFRAKMLEDVEGGIKLTQFEDHA